MMIAKSLLAEALALPPADRLELMSLLWESLDPDDIPVTDAVREELDRREAEYEKDPTGSSSWGRGSSAPPAEAMVPT